MNNSLPKILLLAFILQCCASSQPKQDPVCLLRPVKGIISVIADMFTKVLIKFLVRLRFKEILLLAAYANLMFLRAVWILLLSETRLISWPLQNSELSRKLTSNVPPSQSQGRGANEENSDRCWQHQ